MITPLFPQFSSGLPVLLPAYCLVHLLYWTLSPLGDGLRADPMLQIGFHREPRSSRTNTVLQCLIMWTRDYLALYCYDFLENIGFVYAAMSMIVIGLSLLYQTKLVQSDVWCLLTRIDDNSKGWTESKYLECNPGSELNLFSVEQRTMNKSQTRNKWKSSNEQNKWTTRINNEQQ
jgi:hypothetical protein